jgi:hypothetical protein
MFILNTVTFRPSTFGAKNRWSITFPWWQVYRKTGFRCYVFPLLICWDLSSRTDACADVKYTHTHTHTHIWIQTTIHIHHENAFAYQTTIWTLDPCVMAGREWGVKTIDFPFAHQRSKTSCHIIRMMDKIIIQNYDIYPLKIEQFPGTMKRHYKILRWHNGD